MNLHVVIGEDDFKVDEIVKKILAGNSYEEIDSVQATNADVQLKDLAKAKESFLTAPMFEPVKYTWWRHVNFLPGGGKKNAEGEKGSSEEVKVALEDFVNELANNPLPENQHFILTGAKLLKTSMVAKTLATCAEMIVLEPMKPWQAAQAAETAAIDFAAELGLTFDMNASGAFIRIVGNDTRSIKSEVEKLKCYLGEERKTITLNDVSTITSPGAGVEPDFWAISNALSDRNLEKCLRAVMQFKDDAGFAVMVTNQIERFFRKLYEEGGNPNWKKPEARLARFRFMQLREKAVSGGDSTPDLIITELVKTIRPPRRK